MIDTFTCAGCGHTSPEPVATVATIGICSSCGASSVIETDGTTRRATAADTTALSDVDLQTLRIARGRIARPDRRQR